jgi:ABC-type multidrug transport system fused ATPase/permease subunit
MSDDSFIKALESKVENFLHYLNIIKYIKESLEIVCKARCDEIINDIEETAKLPRYLAGQVSMTIFSYGISYFYRTYIISIIISILMIVFSYWVYKRFVIKSLGYRISIIFIFFVIVIWIYFLSIVTNDIVWLSYISIVLKYIVIASLVPIIIYYISIIYVLRTRCRNRLEELRKRLNRIFSQYMQYAENLNRIFGRSSQIFSQNNKNRRKRYKKYNL